MPRALAVPVRQTIVDRRQAGATVRQIADALGLSCWTVRRIVRRVRAGGAAALAPAYVRCGPGAPHADRRTVRAVRWLRRRHPTWGAGLIGTVLRLRWPDRPVPSDRTLQRWLRQAGLHRPRRRSVRTWHGRGQQPHEVWQLDAVEREPLADGSRVSWLTVSDEATGAILATEVFPPGRLAHPAPSGGAASPAAGVRPLGLAHPAAGR
jgi:transposase